MIPVRRNIDTDELIMWLDPSSPLSYVGNECAVGVGAKGKNQFPGTVNFTNTSTAVQSRSWAGTSDGIEKATVANEPLVADPDGNTRTTAFIETAETGNHYLQCRIETVPPAPQDSSIKDTITYSLYVKQGPGSDRNIRISHTSASPSVTVIFDFATNTIISATGTTEYGSIDAGGGWYRIWYTFQVNVTTVLNNIQASTFIYLLTSANAAVYAGNGTSGVYIWGPQWEQGALSNYTERDPASEFNYFRNNKFVRLASDGTPANPIIDTTTFGGTNFRFNGTTRGLYGGADLRRAFRPDPSNTALLDHSAFAWVKLDKSGTPDAGSSWSPNVKVFAVLGSIGGRSNNGVFGIDEAGTSLVYKQRLIKSAGGTIQPVLQSSTFSDIDNEWHLVGFSFDLSAGQVDFYLDGALVNSVTTPAPVSDVVGGTGSVTLGYFSVSGQPTPSGQFKGLMNTVGFYNKTLNATEHKALYDATKYRFIN
jgi:hypothetical protein